MIKKFAILMLCFVMCFTLCASAEDSITQPQENNPLIQEGTAPAGGRMGGGQPPRMGNGNAQPMQTETEGNPDGQGGNMQNSTAPAEENPQGGDFPQGGQMPGGMGGQMPGSAQTNTQTETGIAGFVKEYTTPVVSVILLALAFVFVTFYKRKTY